MIISIDFDGVLHSDEAQDAVANIDDASTAQLREAGLFAHAELLARLLSPHPNVKLIVHSAWRITSSLERLREVLGPLGPRVVGATQPSLDREQSIMEWLRRNGLGEDAVVVLDDQPELFDRLRSRLVVCDRLRGLADPIVQENLCARLKAGPTVTP